MPLPSSESVVTCTTRAMQALADVARVPVGLENLALAVSPDDVDAQPAMLSRVLDAVDGVLLLDLHNLWCQATNYARDPRELAARYPLARVRQIHVAGGGWSSSAYGEPFRRDTHDALVPADVLDLLAWLIPHCPALEVVILERLPQALADEPARAAWRDEWQRLAAIVNGAAREAVIAVPPVILDLRDSTATLDELATFQDAMTAALFDSTDARALRTTLATDPRFGEQVATWDLRALEVAIALANKWSVRA
jgi:uncharacterized protein (UPF0276 family)